MAAYHPGSSGEWWEAHPTRRNGRALFEPPIESSLSRRTPAVDHRTVVVVRSTYVVLEAHVFEIDTDIVGCKLDVFRGFGESLAALRVGRK